MVVCSRITYTMGRVCFFIAAKPMQTGFIVTFGVTFIIANSCR